MAPAGSRARRAPADKDPRRVGTATTDRPNGPSEISKKLKHVAKLLENAGAAYSEDFAAAWIMPFNDEADPSFTIEQCLNAGWRDPLLLGAAMSIFGNLDRAQRCMAQLNIDPGSTYDLHLIRVMLEARELLLRAS